MEKSETFVKLIYSIKTNMITSFFSTFLVKFLRNSIKYLILRVVLGVLSGALNVALLRALTIQSAFQLIPENEGKNSFAELKLMG